MAANNPLRLLLLTKRHFMTKDIIQDAYGRQYELAAGLAATGWEVRAHCLDYRSMAGTEAIRAGGVDWHSYAAPVRWLSWRRGIRRDARSWKPDVILACSDPLHIVAGYKAARETGLPLVVDLHDNLKSFQLIELPGLRSRLRAAVVGADLVLCVSSRLRDLVAREYGPRGRVMVLENAVPAEFKAPPGDKASHRRRFGLGERERVVGVAGALYRKRGIETILAGYEILKAADPGVVLALAGPADESRNEFQRSGVRYFGNLDYSQVPSFLKMLDVGIVPNIRPAFAEYCHPQKSVEFCALGVPFVGAALGVIRDLARDHSEILYEPGNPRDLARALDFQLRHGVVLDVTVRSWQEQAAGIDRAISELVRSGTM